MPYPAQVDKDQIISAGQRFIEQHGVAQLSLAKLAAELNIKAPSLYRHVKGKAALIQAVNLVTVENLIGVLISAETENHSTGQTQQPQTTILTILQRYRQFGHENPHCYQLAFDGVDAHRPPDALLEELVRPLQSSFAKLVKAEQSLTALRGAFALAHGFVMLELNQVLRRGGDLSEAYTQAVQAYLAGWVQTNSSNQ